MKIKLRRKCNEIKHRLNKKKEHKRFDKRKTRNHKNNSGQVFLISLTNFIQEEQRKEVLTSDKLHFI